MAPMTNSFDTDYALSPFGAAEQVKRKGFWRRVLDAVIDSRKATAEREIRRHSALIARLTEGANAASGKDLPF